MNHPGKYLIGLCMITSIIINTAHGMTKSPRHNNIGVIAVDIQADFANEPVIDPRTLRTVSTRGALGVGRNLDGTVAPYGDTNKDYLKAAQKFTDDMRAYNMPIFFTQDWHPKFLKPHVSFASTWIDKGYENIQLFNPFPDENLPLKSEDKQYKVEGQVMWPDHCIQGSPGARILLKVQPQDTVIQKGANPYVESYSGFEDKDGTKTPLTSELHKRGVTDVIVFGIATDFCVNFTALDALKDGFGVHLVINLSRGVDTNLINQKIEDLITFGANVYYINGLNDGWTPSAAIKETLKKFGVIECTNVADFLNKVHIHMRKGKAVSKIPSIEKESLLEKELARSFAGKLPTEKELQSGMFNIRTRSEPGSEETSGNFVENATLQARDTLRLESEKLRSLINKVPKKRKIAITNNIESFIEAQRKLLDTKIKDQSVGQTESAAIESAFQQKRQQLNAPEEAPGAEEEIKSLGASQNQLIIDVSAALGQESKTLKELLDRINPDERVNAKSEIDSFIEKITREINKKIAKKQLASDAPENIRSAFQTKLNELKASYKINNPGKVEITEEASF